MKIQERLHCHHCDTYQQFEWDLELSGKQVFYCPNCNHPHLREIEETTHVRIAYVDKVDCRFYKKGVDPLLENVPIKYKNGTTIEKRWGSANNIPPDMKPEELLKIYDY